MVFLPGVHIPGYLFGFIYLAISAYLDRRGGSNINHGAHFWGAIYGLVFTYAFLAAFTNIPVFENLKEQISTGTNAIIGCFTPGDR